MMTQTNTPLKASIPFADMEDDFDAIGTSRAAVEAVKAATVGEPAAVRPKLHPFEHKGLGASPFRAVSCTQGEANCAFCGTRIQYLFTVESSDKRRFVVGSDCVEKAAAEIRGFQAMNKNVKRQKAQAAKARKAERDAAVAAELLGFWMAIPENKKLHDYLGSKAPGNEFCTSLLEWLTKHGGLTKGQHVAAVRAMERDAQRAQEKAERVAREAEAAPTVSVAALEEAFARARAAQIKHPRLKLAGFTFKPAGPNSSNPGAVYVTDNEYGNYLGKVMQGKFLKIRECTDEANKEIVEVLNDPKAAAIAYGKKFGVCSVCSRELTDPVSIANGIGPICAENYGW